MSDEPLTNAAVERIRDWYDVLNELVEPPSLTPADSVTDDFAYSDRRKGVNFGEGDASHMARMFRGYWEVGGHPHFSIVEVIAVRGEWSAAYRQRIVYGGSDMFIELIRVVDRDPVGDRLRRMVLFDMDDVDAAIAELDRMHAETDGRSEEPS